MSDAIGSVGDALAQRGLRLATAESCTGGLVAARFTARPGASRFFHAGLVTYSDAAKHHLLGVPADTIARHGAVSEPVARAMLRGALRTADAALAITGIAGPDGGTAEKPVGTVWIGAGLGDLLDVRRYRFDGDRAAVRDASADAAIELLAGLLGDVP